MFLYCKGAMGCIERSIREKLNLTSNSIPTNHVFRLILWQLQGYKKIFSEILQGLKFYFLRNLGGMSYLI